MEIGIKESLQNLEPGQCIARLQRASLRAFDAAAVSAHLHNSHSSFTVIAKRVKGEFTVERIYTLNHAKDAVIFGIVATRIK